MEKDTFFGTITAKSTPEKSHCTYLEFSLRIQTLKYFYKLLSISHVLTKKIQILFNVYSLV